MFFPDFPGTLERSDLTSAPQGCVACCHHGAQTHPPQSRHQICGITVISTVVMLILIHVLRIAEVFAGTGRGSVMTSLSKFWTIQQVFISSTRAKI